MNARAEELEALIRHHQELYYNGEPEISDAEFDLLWDELGRIAPESQVFTDVGADSADGFPKREHLMVMGSQDKAADPEAFRKWAAKVDHETFVVQLKMDGASLELQYQDGNFRFGVTRGDGRVGDDITRNVRRMQGVVETLPDSFTGAVRGEVLMSREVHATRYPDKANTRNAANGLMKRKDGVGADDLVVICYDAQPVDGGEASFTTELEKLSWLSACGFRVVDYVVLSDVEQVILHREEVAGRRDSLEFDIDGLVVKGPALDPEDMRRARPEKQIAFKFELEEAASTLLEVIWSPSGSTYTPIGVMEPVRLAGTTVKRANLVNPRIIREMDLRIGSRVAVTKRGEIIPKIERLLENPPGTSPISQPGHCEACSAALVDEGARLYCPNELCPKRSRYRLRKWLDVLDVRDFGDVILGKLFESGKVQRIADLYTLSVEDLSAFERMGETLARKILRNLNAVHEVPLARFLAGFNIEGVGELIMAKAIDAGYDTLEKMRQATVEELAEVPGIGEITAGTIVDGLRLLAAEIDAVLASGSVRIASAGGGDLAGQSFCFTGTLNTMSRKQAEDLVRAAGGAARSSVVKDLSFLVTNNPDSGSGKARKAADLGIKIISESEFLEMIGQDK